MARSSTTFGPGNQAIRRKAGSWAKATRDEIDKMSWPDPETGEVLTGRRALLRRLFLIATRGEDREATAAAKLIFERGEGLPKQSIELSGEVSTGESAQIDWSTTPLERRRQLLEAAHELGALAGDDESATEH